MQSFILLLPDGTPFTASMADVEYFRLFCSRLAINYGSQIGASVAVFFVLLILTKREKMLSWIFIINALCLVINIIRSLLQALYTVGHWANMYAVLSVVFGRVTATDKGITIAAGTLTLFLAICIFISLSMQVWIVCVTAGVRQRVIIMGATTTVALVAVGYRFTITAISNMQTMKYEGMAEYDHLVTSSNIAQAVAIWMYCAVFTSKLGYALLQRRRLGMTQFGPMQIIFVMGCQTMVIPGTSILPTISHANRLHTAIFFVLQFESSIPELGSQALTVTCIFLPLSAIWAGVSNTDSGFSDGDSSSHRHMVKGYFGRTPVGSPEK
ncbi:hypothetical protein CC78DRAFT_497809, partial [Lojkania enalia]